MGGVSNKKKMCDFSKKNASFPPPAAPFFPQAKKKFNFFVKSKKKSSVFELPDPKMGRGALRFGPKSNFCSIARGWGTQGV